MLYITRLILFRASAKPHTSVSDTLLHEHFDTNLAKGERVRQLSIWSTSRMMEPESAATANGRGRNIKQTTARPRSAPRPPGGDQLSKDIEAERIRQIGEKRIDTSGGE